MSLKGVFNMLEAMEAMEAMGLQSPIGQLETLIEVVRNSDLGD